MDDGSGSVVLDVDGALLDVCFRVLHQCAAGASAQPLLQHLPVAVLAQLLGLADYLDAPLLLAAVAKELPGLNELDLPPRLFPSVLQAQERSATDPDALRTMFQFILDHPGTEDDRVFHDLLLKTYQAQVTLPECVKARTEAQGIGSYWSDFIPRHVVDAFEAVDLDHAWPLILTVLRDVAARVRRAPLNTQGDAETLTRHMSLATINSCGSCGSTSAPMLTADTDAEDNIDLAMLSLLGLDQAEIWQTCLVPVLSHAAETRAFLSLRGCTKIPVDTVSRLLPILPRLVFLDLAGVSSVNAASVSAIVHSLPDLQVLDLSGTSVDDGAMTLLGCAAQTGLASLAMLNLGDCRLSNHGLQALVPLMPRLLDLCLYGVHRLTFASVEALCLHAKALMRLNIAGVYKVSRDRSLMQCIWSSLPSTTMYHDLGEFARLHPLKPVA